jgi:hypothetical protein
MHIKFEQYKFCFFLKYGGQFIVAVEFLPSIIHNLV